MVCDPPVLLSFFSLLNLDDLAELIESTASQRDREVLECASLVCFRSEIADSQCTVKGLLQDTNQTATDRYGYGDPIRGYPTVSTIGGWYVLVVGGATQLNVTPARALKLDEARAVGWLHA
jgi:hypothetical protein